MAHPLAVFADPSHHDGAPVRGRKAAITPEDLEARRETLYVPLPWSWQRLVEIVDVEQHAAFRRTEQAEVRQMRVAAQLHGHPRRRSSRQVGGHDRRGASVEGER